MGLKGREKVKRQYSLQECRLRMYRILEELMEGPVPSRREV